MADSPSEGNRAAPARVSLRPSKERKEMPDEEDVELTEEELDALMCEEPHNPHIEGIEVEDEE